MWLVLFFQCNSTFLPLAAILAAIAILAPSKFTTHVPTEALKCGRMNGCYDVCSIGTTLTHPRIELTHFAILKTGHRYDVD